MHHQQPQRHSPPPPKADKLETDDSVAPRLKLNFLTRCIYAQHPGRYGIAKSSALSGEKINTACLNAVMKNPDRPQHHTFSFQLILLASRPEYPIFTMQSCQCGGIHSRRQVTWKTPWQRSSHLMYYSCLYVIWKFYPYKSMSR